MAERPVFVPCTKGDELVRELAFEFEWNPGFAPVQKKKNVKALHAAAAAQGYSPLLEVSSKSDEKLGQRLSAFSLKVKTRRHGVIPLECAFQGSKVFESGGPYTDLYSVTSRDAKKDPRIRNSGRIVSFQFEDVDFPTEPTTAFYDWLYLGALYPHRDFLARLKSYRGFTDIEFNPSRSINCQARSCALFVAMMDNGSLDEALESPAAFVAAMKACPSGNSKWKAGEGADLFASRQESGVDGDDRETLTSESVVQATVKRERQVRAFAELSHANGVLLENAQQEQGGYFYELMASILLSAFRFEAYLNYIGEALFPFWKEMERLRWRAKLNILQSHLGISAEYCERPYQTLTPLFRFRDALAHGRSEHLDEPENVEVGTLEELRRKQPLTAWEKLCTRGFAEQAYTDTEQVILAMHQRAGLPECELHRDGHSYAIKGATLLHPGGES